MRSFTLGLCLLAGAVLLGGCGNDDPAAPDPASESWLVTYEPDLYVWFFSHRR